MSLPEYRKIVTRSFAGMSYEGPTGMPKAHFSEFEEPEEEVSATIADLRILEERLIARIETLLADIPTL